MHQMCESNYYDEGNGKLSQFVKTPGMSDAEEANRRMEDDAEIVEKHLQMVANANQDKIAREKSIIPLFGPDRKLFETNKNKNRGEFTLSKIDPLLLSILSHRRPHAGKTEEKFIERWIDTVEGMKVDGFGNRYIRIGDAPVLWSCHTDTVHSDEGYQKIHVTDEWVHLAKKERNGGRGWRNCLGADDGSGIYLCLKMIERQIPGLYVFHRGEEIGGLGSGWAAVHAEDDFFEDISMAIALDRKGYDSVITYQGSRCCSNKYAQALADQLGGEFKPDSTGLFTDTANYTSIIPECTNLSVGYFRQHGPQEVQNYKFLDVLLEKLCEIDIEALPIERDVNDHGYSYGGYYDRSTFKSKFDSDTWDRPKATSKTNSVSIDGDDDNFYQDDNFDYDPKTNVYTPKKSIHSHNVITTGGVGDNYNGREYDALDPWDDDPNNPDQYEAARRIHPEEPINLTESWVNAMNRDTAYEQDDEFEAPNDPNSEETQHRFRMFETAAREFPAMIADMLYEQNITLQEIVEMDPWVAAALLMNTDVDEEYLSACIEDELENVGYPDGVDIDDPAY